MTFASLSAKLAVGLALESQPVNSQLVASKQQYNINFMFITGVLICIFLMSLYIEYYKILKEGFFVAELLQYFQVLTWKVVSNFLKINFGYAGVFPNCHSRARTRISLSCCRLTQVACGIESCDY